MDIKKQKLLLRQKIWKELEQKGIARFPLPCKDRVPNYAGSDAAAEKLQSTEEWKKAKTIFCNPDYAQKRVRELALKDGKDLVMPTPKIEQGYLLIKAKGVKGLESFAATIKGAFKLGKAIEKMPRIDLVVEGSVAVDKQGHRLGKGGGYGDVEIATLKQQKAITGKTPIVSLVHDVQIVPEVPFEEHDQLINIIVTPKKIFRLKNV